MERPFPSRADFGLDPIFHCFVQRVGPHARGIDGTADAHGDLTGIFQERVTRPDMAGVVRHRNHRRTGLDREPGAAQLVGPPLARREPVALGEDHDPEPLREPLAPLLEGLPERLHAGAALDGDGAHHGQAPAEERHPQELALDHPDLRRQEDLKRERLPGRLVLGEDDAGLSGEVLQSAHFVVDAAERAGQPDHHARPDGDEAVAGQRVQGKGEQRQQRPDDGQCRLHQEEQQRAHNDHAMIARTAAARSS